MSRQNNRRRKKNSTLKLILVFVITLSAVLAVGLIFIFFTKRQNEQKTQDTETVQEETSDDDGSIGDRVMFSEAIPEDERRDAEQKPDESEADENADEAEEDQAVYADVLSDEEYMSANGIYTREAADPDAVTLTFAGDILLDDSYAVAARLRENGGDISAAISSELLEQMRDSDVFMLNNEFPYSSGGEPLQDKTYTFRADPDSVEYLADMGVDLVSIANNHAFDYGETAFLDTLTTLENADMPYVGGGRNIDEASRPVYYIINDIKIGFLAATQIERLDNPDTRGAGENQSGVFRCLDNTRLLNKIAEVKENCDFLVVYIHWGTESTNETDWLQQQQAPQMAEAGADLIIGDHPHVLQPITYIDGVPVVYSLGNFWFNSSDTDTCLIKARIDKNGLQSLQFVPCRQSGCKTEMLHGTQASDLINYMQSISPEVNFDAEGYITH